jgi:hypothetical protein
MVAGLKMYRSRKFCFGQSVLVRFSALNMISSERMAFIAWFFFFTYNLLVGGI